MRSARRVRNTFESVASAAGAASWLVLAFLGIAGCEDSAEPLPEPVTFSGELVSQGSAEHTVSLSEAGLIVLAVDDVELRDIETGELSPLTTALRLGLGRPDTDPDDDDTDNNELPDFCDETFFAGVLEGSNQVFRLEGQDYCVSLTDSATTPAIPEGKVAVYTMSLTPAE